MENRRKALDSVVDLVAHIEGLITKGTKELDLTPVRAHVLYSIHELGPMRQKALSAVVGCSTQQLGAILDALETKGLTQRTPDPSDRRASLVSLTKEGRRLGNRVDEMRATVADDLFHDLGDTQVDEFARVADILTGRAEARVAPGLTA